MENNKQINVKNWAYYLFNDMINIKDFDSSLLKTSKNSYKTLLFTTMDISQSKRLKVTNDCWSNWTYRRKKLK